MNFQQVMAAATALRDAMGKANHERSRDDASPAYYAALDTLIPLREALREALLALPKAERDIFVAMYDTLRCWAYDQAVGLP